MGSICMVIWPASEGCIRRTPGATRGRRRARRLHDAFGAWAAWWAVTMSYSS